MAWTSVPGKVDHDVMKVLGNIKNCGVKLVLVTNATSRLNADLTNLGIFDAFDDIINSSVIGFVKPQNEIFQKALKTAKVKPENALFIDDNNENVQAARKNGINGHHYQGLEDFLIEWQKIYA